MLQPLHDLPPGIEGVHATGTVTKDDYTRVLEPLLAAALRGQRRLRFVYEIGPGLEHFTAGAAWEDLRVGLENLSAFEGIAVVSDVGWVHHAVRIFGFAMPFPVRVFGVAERARAIAWLESLPPPAWTTSQGEAHREARRS